MVPRCPFLGKTYLELRTPSAPLVVGMFKSGSEVPYRLKKKGPSLKSSGALSQCTWHVACCLGFGEGA